MQNIENQNQEQGGVANLRYGPYSQASSIVGKTVKEVREQFAGKWGIPTDATAYRGKDKMDENYVIQANDNLEFHRRAGEKGW